MYVALKNSKNDLNVTAQTFLIQKLGTVERFIFKRGQYFAVFVTWWQILVRPVPAPVHQISKRGLPICHLQKRGQVTIPFKNGRVSPHRLPFQLYALIESVVRYYSGTRFLSVPWMTRVRYKISYKNSMIMHVVLSVCVFLKMQCI